MPRNGHARDYYYEDDAYVYERDRDRYANGSRRDRTFKEQEEIEADERDDVEFYRRERKFSGGAPVLDVGRVRVRGRDRSAPDSMRESFAPRKESGQLVLSRGRERDEIDVTMSGALVGPGRSRGGGRKEMEADVDVDVDRDRREDRGVYQHSTESRGRRPPRREVEMDELIIREKDIGRERGRRSPPPVEREEIIIKEKRDLDERRRPARRDIERDEIVLKRRDRSLPVRRGGYEEAEEVMVRRDRRDERPRRQPSLDREREEITFRFEEVDGEPRRRYQREQDDVRYASKPRRRASSSPRHSREAQEEILIRTSERDRGRCKADSEREDEEIIIREKEWDRGRGRGKVERDEEIIIQEKERDRGRRRGNLERDEEIIILEKERDRGRRRTDVQAEEEEIIIRQSERERGRRRADAERTEEDILIRMRERDERQRKDDIDMEEEDIIIRQSQRDRKRRGERREKDEEIIIRHREARSSSPEPPPLREPPVIRAPPIHQEIITHHRHIDHGFESVRAPSRESKSPRSSFEELEFHHRETRGRSSHEDIVIERRGKHDSPSPVRRHSPKRDEQSKSEEVVISRSSGRPRPLDREQEIVIRERKRRNTLDSRDELDIREEADFYERRNAERASIGEAYHGALKDWAIVDVPPGTKRVTMDGVGGASEEISWQRYNGVRRSRFLPNGEASSVSDDDESSFNDSVGQIGRRYHGAKDKRDRLWTEITKDLVIKEALDRAGYEYEETEYFYYVFSYLRYGDISTLVDLSDEIRRARRERIHEIHRERVSMPLPLPPPPAKTPAQQPWNRIEYKEEVVIDEGRRPSRRW